MSIIVIIPPAGGGGGGGGGLDDGNYGAFSVAGGTATLNVNSVTDECIAEGEISPQKLSGFTELSSANGNVLGKTADEWDAVDPSPNWQGFIAGEVLDGTFTAILNARREMVLNALVAKSATGTCDVTVQIDAVNVTGLVAVGVTATEATTNASANNTVSAGATVTIIIDNASSLEDVSLQLNFTYV